MRVRAVLALAAVAVAVALGGPARPAVAAEAALHVPTGGSDE